MSLIGWELLRQLVYQVYYSRYHVSFYLWSIECVLKHCQLRKYYNRDCLKIFFLLSTLPALIPKFGKMLISFKKVISVKQPPISDGESF